MAFVGLILGGLPMLWKSMRNELKKSRSTIGVPGVLFSFSAFSSAAVSRF